MMRIEPHVFLYQKGSLDFVLSLFNRSGPDPLEHQAAGAGNPAVSDASGGRCAAGGPGSWPRGAEYPLRDGVAVSDQ